MGLSTAARKATWLEKLTNDLGIRLVRPIAIHCDNKASMKMAINLEVNHRNKHINAHYYFSRKKILMLITTLVEKDDIELYYVPILE